MSVNENVKNKIFDEISSLSNEEQQTVLGLVENFVHNKVDETEWEQLPGNWKTRITESLAAADSGNLILHEDAVSYIRKKYGLNG